MTTYDPQTTHMNRIMRPVPALVEEDGDKLLELAALLTDPDDLLNARAACIEEALRGPFISKEEAFELLDELGGIYTELGKE